MTALVHSLRQRYALAKTLLAILEHDTQYNEERYDLRNFFISDSNNQACVVSGIHFIDVENSHR